MINIAVVEDDLDYMDTLKKYLKKYSEESGETFKAVYFRCADELLASYNFKYSLLLMDIDMPGTNGMTAAGKIREKDKDVIIVFITNLAHYAIKGYEVNALDFIVKPVQYKDFSIKLKRAMNKGRNMMEYSVQIPLSSGFRKVSTRSLLYVEVIQHTLIYHLDDEVIQTRQSLKEVIHTLAPYGFLRCNNCYLVNPKHITYVKGLELGIGGEVIRISKPRRKEFMREWMEWLTGTGKGGEE